MKINFSRELLIILFLALFLLTGCKTLQKSTIEFEINGGERISDLQATIGSSISEPETPLREGYTFGGWYSDELLTNQYIFNTMPAKDITLYAKWVINQYTISFDCNGGSEVDSINQDYNTSINEPTEPTKEGYTFEGWYSDELLTNEYIFNTIPGEDITLYAKWVINQYSISFNYNDGRELICITQNYNTTINEPIESKEGYTFGGWYSDELLTNEYILNAMPAANIMLYAKWIINQYTITFESNGGSVVDSITQEYNTSIYEPTVPSKEGYTFEGWYSNESLTNRYTFNTMPAEDITLYANWIVNEYTITYLDSIDTQIVNSSLGFTHTIVITSEGHIFTWGDNEYGQLGDGTTENKYTPTDITLQFNLNAGESIISFSAGGCHSIALTSEGRVFTWGSNSSGELGDGTNEDKYTPTNITAQFNLNPGESIVSIEAGGSFTVALTSEGRIFTWGDNYTGQLGDGTTENKNVPTDITSQFNLYPGESITSIKVGLLHTFVLTSEGRIFAWGDNEAGQIGDGTFDHKLTPTDITSQFNLNAEESIIDVKPGVYHTVAITSNGRIFTWGFFLGLGNGTSDSKLTPTDITTQFNLNTGESILYIEAGFFHTGLLTSEGRIFTWGDNQYGQLGDGTLVEKLTPTNITSHFYLNTEENIISIEMGGFFTAILTSEGRIFTWGENEYGQLGDGTPVNKNTPLDITTQFPGLLTQIGEHTYEYSSDLSNMPTTVKDGYTFAGWYTDEILTIPFTLTTMPAEDIALYAKWIKE